MTRTGSPALLYQAACLLSLHVFLSGCLDHRVEDEPGYSHRLWPQGREPRALEDNERLLATVVSSDGLGAPRMPLHTGFLAGEEVHYWDFGEAAGEVAPAWIFRRRLGDAGAEEESVGHPALVDTAPGDDDYGPLRALFVAYVTDRYRGQVIPSFSALEDAVELGLVEQPVPTGEVVAWPMARPGAELELHDGQVGEPTGVLYRGHLVPCFTLESFAPALGEVMRRFGNASAASAYTLRRQSESGTIDEPGSGMDLNGDGDMIDSNIVFTVGPGDMGYTGLVSLVDVTVKNTYMFGDAREADALFTRSESGLEAVLETVVEYTQSGTVLFRPILPP
ncbi:MAG: hypothetical protein OXU20_42875 [Myxococcales bacterium]|nr:hypothetical protein [Myxococcales bacterium]MDD9966597.1 hypothetical protein [Myxococcales bacterium]